MIRRRLALIAVLCLVGACSKGHGDGQAHKLAFPNIILFHRAAPSVPMRCDAPSLTWLVGKARTAIPVAADLDKRRVACTTCPAAADNRPDRTDILYDDKTDRITQVTCG